MGLFHSTLDLSFPLPPTYPYLQPTLLPLPPTPCLILPLNLRPHPTIASTTHPPTYHTQFLPSGRPTNQTHQTLKASCFSINTHPHPTPSSVTHLPPAHRLLLFCHIPLSTSTFFDHLFSPLFQLSSPDPLTTEALLIT